MVSYVLVDVARDLPGVRRRTPRLELAPPAVVHACPVRQDTALVDEAVIGEELTRRADVDVALPIEDKIRSAKLAVGPSRFVPYGHVWCDLAIHKPLKQPGHAINCIAREPLGPKIKAAPDAVQHGLGDGDLLFAISARACGVEDDPDLVVDKVVCIVGEERVDALSCDPRRLRVRSAKLV